MAIKLTVWWAPVQDSLFAYWPTFEYKRNDTSVRGTFRVRGDVVDVPAGQILRFAWNSLAMKIERLRKSTLTGEILDRRDNLQFSHQSLFNATRAGRKSDCWNWVGLINIWNGFEDNGKFLERKGWVSTPNINLEMLKETGFIERDYYSLFDGQEPGEQPATLVIISWRLVAFGWLVFTWHCRKFGECAIVARRKFWLSMVFAFQAHWIIAHFDFDEFNQHIHQAIYVFRHMEDYELSHSPKPAGQLIRPTGFAWSADWSSTDKRAVDDLSMEEIKPDGRKGHRVLVTT